MVGVSGFEPPTSWSQTMRANPLRHTPISKLIRFSGTPGGTFPEYLFEKKQLVLALQQLFASYSKPR
jgi:hypothetical protein